MSNNSLIDRCNNASAHLNILPHQAPLVHQNQCLMTSGPNIEKMSTSKKGNAFITFFWIQQKVYQAIYNSAQISIPNKKYL